MFPYLKSSKERKGGVGLFSDIKKVMLFSDMDGTLLDSKKQISSRDRAAIEKFTALGGKFTVATGRTIQTFAQYRSMIDLGMPIIMYNGGVIYDYETEKLLSFHPLPDECRGMTAEIMRYMPDCGGEVLKKEGTYVFSDTEYEKLHTRLCGIIPEYCKIDDIPEGEWLKVLFSLAPEDIPHLELLTAQLGFDKRVDFVRSSEIFLEMMPKNITKGSALEEYRRVMKMEDYTFVAVGDFNNDIEMIKAADLGACPANAEGSVKNAADLVLNASNDQGAVAELIDHIIARCNIINVNE